MSPQNHGVSKKACPKCAAPRPDGADTCPGCGVIFAKLRQREAESPTTAGEPAPSTLPTTADPAASAVAWLRGAFLALLLFHTFRLLTHPIGSNYVGESFLHLVNLPFHEAGHVLFSPFGRFLQVAGGTLMQLIIPSLVAGYFLARHDRFGGAVGLWWLGESLADVAPYADDARAGQLMLLGGVTGQEVEDYHDWEIMLKKLGLLSWDHAIGRIFFVAGGIVMIAALVYGAVSTIRLAKGGPGQQPLDG